MHSQWKSAHVTPVYKSGDGEFVGVSYACFRVSHYFCERLAHDTLAPPKSLDNMITLDVI